MQFLSDWRMRRYLESALLGVLLLALAGLYWYGAILQLESANTDVNRTDQREYIDFTRRVYETGFRYTGGRNRMPVYAYLQALFYKPGLSLEASFQRGKYVNLMLSGLLLFGIGAIFFRSLRRLHALNLLIIVSFTLFMFKAGCFQADLLYYFFSFVLFLLMWRLLRRPSWPLALLAGVVAGGAHLTKASVLPGLMLFLLCAVINSGYRLQADEGAEDEAQSGPSVREYALAPLIVGALFLLTVFPYIRESKQRYGQYFYNVNTTFYFWYDSWQEVKKGTRAHGDEQGWPDMPDSEIPGPRKYLREHTLRQIGGRLYRGAKRLVKALRFSYGSFKYLTIFAGLLFFLGLWNRKRVRRSLKQEPIPFLFLCAYFGIYFTIYAWYVPITAGNRLILSVFVPVMFALSVGLRELNAASEADQRTFRLFNLILLPILLADVYFIVAEKAAITYGCF